MSLQARLQADLTQAMRDRDRERVAALRLVIAAVKNAAVAANRGPQGELDDDEVRRVLATEVKRRREAADAFRTGGREEQAAKEEAEAAIYGSYLPAQMDDDELSALVDRVIADVGATGPRDIGQVMRAAMAAVEGRADGGRVSAVVKERLGAGG